MLLFLLPPPHMLQKWNIQQHNPCPISPPHPTVSCTQRGRLSDQPSSWKLGKLPQRLWKTCNWLSATAPFCGDMTPFGFLQITCWLFLKMAQQPFCGQAENLTVMLASCVHKSDGNIAVHITYCRHYHRFFFKKSNWDTQQSILIMPHSTVTKTKPLIQTLHTPGVRSLHVWDTHENILWVTYHLLSLQLWIPKADLKNCQGANAQEKAKEAACMHLSHSSRYLHTERVQEEIPWQET